MRPRAWEQVDLCCILRAEAVIQHAERRPIDLISQQIADEALRARVVRLAMQITPHELAQAELASVAMEYLASKNQQLLDLNTAYEEIFRRILRRVQSALMGEKT